MFMISIPIESEKGYLISSFQAGEMRFPEKCFISMPSWRPIDFILHCISDLEKMLSGEHNSACIPVSLCEYNGAIVPSCYWCFNKINSSTIGFNQIFRYDESHFNSIHYDPKDWWRDAAFHEIWLNTTDCVSVANWLDFYKEIVACAEGKPVVRCSDSRSGLFSLTPFMCGDGGRRACGIQVPSINCTLVLDARPSDISPGRYLECWRTNMTKLLDDESEASVLALEVDRENAITKWIGMECVDSGHFALSKPQDCLLEVPFMGENDLALPTKLSPNMESVVRDTTNWATITREDAENWVYWANTVLSGISIIDDDPDVVPCRCGTSSVYGY